jgi:hypothetical protein
LRVWYRVVWYKFTNLSEKPPTSICTVQKPENEGSSFLQNGHQLSHPKGHNAAHHLNSSTSPPWKPQIFICLVPVFELASFSTTNIFLFYITQYQTNDSFRTAKQMPIFMAVKEVKRLTERVKVCPCVSRARLHTEFRWHLACKDYTKICRANFNFVRIRQISY